MKNWQKAVIYIALTCVLCACVGLAVYLRMSWCRVTFVCEEGCEHVTWTRVGESADTSVVAEAHQEERPDEHIAGIYQDEKRLINYLGEPLADTEVTLYIGDWKGADVMDLWFFTPYGTIVVYLDDRDFKTYTLSKYLLAALEALGGYGTDFDDHYVFECVINGTQRNLIMAHTMIYIEQLRVCYDGSIMTKSVYKYIRIVEKEPVSTEPSGE